MNLAILSLLAIVAVIVIWAAARLARASRMRRGGLDVSAEDRRLRTDPRFTEVWVQHLKKEAPEHRDETSST